MAEKAAILSIKSLSAAVAKAAEKDRQIAKLDTRSIASHNPVMGFWLDGDVALKDAEAMASRITGEIRNNIAALESRPGAGSHFEPAFMGIGGGVIIGFILNGVLTLGE